jgi:hypothetical protein
MRGRADAEEALRPQARAGLHQAAARRSGAAGPQVTAALEDRWPLGPRCDPLSCSSGAKMRQGSAHARCAATTTTATARVDLDHGRCARAGVGPCRMARIVLKGCGLPRCCARLPQERQTIALLACGPTSDRTRGHAGSEQASGIIIDGLGQEGAICGRPAHDPVQRTGRQIFFSGRSAPLSIHSLQAAARVGPE